MNVLYPTGDRTLFYGRSPTYNHYSIVLNGIAPHGGTQRGLYQVPTSSRAVITSIGISIYRVTAAVAAGRAYALLKTIFGASSLDAFTLKHQSNTVGYFDKIAFGCEIHLEANDGVEYETGDGSNGGTQDYAFYISYIEYIP